MTASDLRTVTLTRRFDISAERIFDAFLNPEIAAKFLFATPTGQMVRADIDPHVGGHFTFTDRRDGQDIEHTGTYLEIDRPRRLVFTFAVPKFSAQSTTVTIDLHPLPPPATGCQLTLTHQGVLPDYADRTHAGWNKILTGLAANADPNFRFGTLIAPGTLRFERTLPGPIERVWEFLTNPEKRASWFAGGPLEPRTGGTLELRFHHAKLAVPGEVPSDRHKDLATCEGPNFQVRITAYDPPRRFAWEWDGGIDGTPSEVLFELSPQGDQVLLTLTQRGLASKHLPGNAAGWHTHLALLLDRLSNRPTESFWSLLTNLESQYEARFK